MHTVKAFQKSREEVINRQQEEMLELSTPVVKLWEGVIALPMIGTLDSARTQVVMESLLQRIVETGSEIAIIDITGVPTVDTLVAQHLLKTVTAIRLMGADCIISGIRPQIAQTIVHLGIDLQGVTTKANAGRRAGAGAQALRPGGDQGTEDLGSADTWTASPFSRMGEFLLVTIQVDMHDQLALTLQDDLTQQIDAHRREGRADRHLGARDGRLVHRPHDRQHLADVAHPRCPHRGRRHASGGGDHAGRARIESGGRAHGARCRARHAASAPAPRGDRRRR